MTKFSERPTREAAAQLAAIAESLERITKAPAVSAWANSRAVANLDVQDLFSIVPLILRDCYDDAAEVLGVLLDKSAEEVGNQPVLQTLHELEESLGEEVVTYLLKRT